MCWVPVTDGLYVTWHVAELPLPLNVHWPFAGVNVPFPSLVNVTVPPGVPGVPVLVSVTVAVHVVEPFTGTEVGEQLTLVVVLRFVTVIETVATFESELPSFAL